MKLTKLQRHTAYIIMLAEVESHYKKMNGGWFCYLIYDLFGFTDDMDIKDFRTWNDDSERYMNITSGIGNVMQRFPELYTLFKSDYPSHCDLAKRISIIERCIEQTA